ncbi:MAG: phage portal protein [Bacteroidales bacterium]|nr:phage portal protein [Bacteroidales bacterium]
MEIQELKELFSLTDTSKIVEALRKSSFDVPKWAELEKQYDPLKHKINDTAIYPPITDENGKDDFKRTSLGLQKLFVDRITQAMFATHPTLTYSSVDENENTTKAIELFEEIYLHRNYINDDNIERGRSQNSACEIVTLWKVIDKPQLIKGIKSTKKVKHITYSPDKGYSIFAQTDNDGEITVISIGYKDENGIDVLDTYTDDTYYKFINKDGWQITKQAIPFMPLVHKASKEPVWGGEAVTKLIEQIEEELSFQGLYNKRNSKPTFARYKGKKDPTDKDSTTTEKSTDTRAIINIGEGGFIKDVTWQGALESVKDRRNTLRNAAFEQAQVADISFNTLINTNTSAENKEFLLTDTKAKAIDLGGEWIKFFYEETQLVLRILADVYSEYREVFENLTVSTKINPYSVNTTKENVEVVEKGGSAMSLETKIKTIGLVSDIQAEAEAIRSEQSALANQGL